MKRTYPLFFLSIIAICVILLAAVCWHSVGEIHYLKSFFPGKFSVEEAYYASLVELIKIAIICFPVIVIIGISLFMMRYFDNKSGNDKGGNN
jgi:hypothetical protein